MGCQSRDAFLLCVKYVWVIPSKNKKTPKTTKAFQKRFWSEPPKYMVR